MREQNTMKNGAERLYGEDVTVRNSPAFSWINSRISSLGLDILRRILGGIGTFINKNTGWIAKYIPQETEENKPGYQTGEPQAEPALASGYRMAMQTMPIGSYPTHTIPRQTYGRCFE